MSTPQRTHARITLVVDRYTADVLRLEAKKILMFGHEPFEDFLDLNPEAQHALAMRFQDAIDLITTVGWDPTSSHPKVKSFEIVVTQDMVQQLAHRRLDLGATNTDRLSDFEDDEPIPAEVVAGINADRNAATALDHVIGAYGVAHAQVT
jgi:hypothetical protein